MSRNRYFILCILVLVGAFGGGLVANRAIPVAHAQVIGPEDIRATGFTLVNPQGKALASIRDGSRGAEIILNDTNGKSRVEISASGGIVVRDVNGRVEWASPRAFGIVPASE